MQLKPGIPSQHSSLPSTGEHFGNSSWAPAGAPGSEPSWSSPPALNSTAWAGLNLGFGKPLLGDTAAIKDRGETLPWHVPISSIVTCIDGRGSGNDMGGKFQSCREARCPAGCCSTAFQILSPGHGKLFSETSWKNIRPLDIFLLGDLGDTETKPTQRRQHGAPRNDDHPCFSGRRTRWLVKSGILAELSQTNLQTNEAW